MQSVLSKIKTGSPPSPLRLLFYGIAGIGKTTLAAQIPGALFLTCEDGGGDMDYARIDVGDWASLRATLTEIEREGAGEYRALVLDTINGLVEQCASAICQQKSVDSIEEVGGGFGKGYTLIQEEMGRLRDMLDRIRQKWGIHIVLLGHAHVKSFNDPTGPSYDRYMLRMNEKVAATWVAWADVVGFAVLDAVVKGGKKGSEIDDPMKKGKATAGKRMLYLTSDVAYDAKNRHNLPDELPLSWPAFAKAIDWSRREKALLPPETTEADVAAALHARPDVQMTEEEAAILAGRMVVAVGVDKSLHMAKRGLSGAVLAAKLDELRAGGK